MIYVFLQATLKSLIKFLTDQEKEAGFGHTGHFKHFVINKKVKSAQSIFMFISQPLILHHGWQLFVNFRSSPGEGDGGPLPPSYEDTEKKEPTPTFDYSILGNYSILGYNSILGNNLLLHIPI